MSPALTVDFPSVLADPTSWAAVALGCGAYLFYRGFGLLARQRLISNTPRSTVRGAALGLVELCGKAVGPYTLISPLAALVCLYYRAVAWKNEGPGWTRVAEETLCTPLFLDDTTGRLLVDPRGAEFDLAAAFSHEYADSALSSEFIPAYIAEFLHRHGISGEKQLKLEEYCILPGDTLFVLGTLQENDRNSTNALRRAGAGFVSQAAADLQCRGMLESFGTASRDSPSREMGPTTNPPAEFSLQPETALMKGSPDDPFFISWCGRREVALTLSWQAFLYLWCGPVLILAGLWLMLRSLRGQ